MLSGGGRNGAGHRHSAVARCNNAHDLHLWTPAGYISTAVALRRAIAACVFFYPPRDVKISVTSTLSTAYFSALDAEPADLGITPSYGGRLFRQHRLFIAYLFVTPIQDVDTDRPFCRVSLSSIPTKALFVGVRRYRRQNNSLKHLDVAESRRRKRLLRKPLYVVRRSTWTNCLHPILSASSYISTTRRRLPAYLSAVASRSRSACGGSPIRLYRGRSHIVYLKQANVAH